MGAAGIDLFPYVLKGVAPDKMCGGGFLYILEN